MVFEEQPYIRNLLFLQKTVDIVHILWYNNTSFERNMLV